MTPSILRLFWNLVYQAQPNLILHLEDDKLTNWLTDQVRQKSYLDRNQENDLTSYISDRIPLIRDIASNQ
jgi:polynucleotide 5'-kinase involved in rRNA processing